MLDDEAVPAWSGRNWMLLFMPMAKFALGCATYIVSVIFTTYRDLAEVPVYQTISLAIGLGSVSTVLMTIVMLGMMKTPEAPARAAEKGEEDYVTLLPSHPLTGTIAEETMTDLPAPRRLPPPRPAGSMGGSVRGADKSVMVYTRA